MKNGKKNNSPNSDPESAKEEKPVGETTARVVELSAKEYEELKQKAAERDDYHNKWLAVHAEYENTKRRMDREKTNHIKFANEEIISRLFLITDHFDMAMDAMDKAEDKAAVLDGIKLVQKEFHRILEENGAKRIETKGKMFDPNFHEAVLMADTADHPDGIILEEVRSGYMLNDRLLRPAQVKVARNVAA